MYQSSTIRFYTMYEGRSFYCGTGVLQCKIQSRSRPDLVYHMGKSIGLNSMISSIPNYFNNSKTPIIGKKYNRPIRSNIFKFDKIVTDINIDSNTSYS